MTTRPAAPVVQPPLISSTYPHVLPSPHMASTLDSDITFDTAKDIVKQGHNFLIFEICIQPLYMAQASMDINR
jgi:hypothetical protein